MSQADDTNSSFFEKTIVAINYHVNVQILVLDDPEQSPGGTRRNEYVDKRLDGSERYGCQTLGRTVLPSGYNVVQKISKICFHTQEMFSF